MSLRLLISTTKICRKPEIQQELLLQKLELLLMLVEEIHLELKQWKIAFSKKRIREHRTSTTANSREKATSERNY
jgi:hypothetical protein